MESNKDNRDNIDKTGQVVIPYQHDEAAGAKLMSITETNLSSDLQNIIIILDTKCMLECRYCYISKQFKSSSAKLDCEALFAEVEHYAMTCRVLNIEVSGQLNRHIIFLRKLLGLSLTYPSVKFHFFFQLNGTELTEEVLAIIKEYRVNIGISNDGIDHVNTNLRVFKGKEQSGTLIRQAIEKLHNNQIGFSIRCTISNQNVQDVGTLMKSLGDMHPKAVFLNRLIYKQDSVIDYSYLMVPIGRFLNFYESYHQMAFEASDLHLVDVNLKRWFYRFCNHPKGWTHYCSTGRCRLNKVITPAGTYPCPKYVGTPISQQSQMNAYRKSYCQSCPVLEICQGGCPLGNNFRDGGLSDECLYVRFLYGLYLRNKNHLKLLLK